MGEYKLTKTVSGKYKKLGFEDGVLFAYDKDGTSWEVDLLAELQEVYGDSKFSLSTSSKEEADVTPDDVMILE